MTKPWWRYIRPAKSRHYYKAVRAESGDRVARALLTEERASSQGRYPSVLQERVGEVKSNESCSVPAGPVPGS